MQAENLAKEMDRIEEIKQSLENMEEQNGNDQENWRKEWGFVSDHRHNRPRQCRKADTPLEDLEAWKAVKNRVSMLCKPVKNNTSDKSYKNKLKGHESWRFMAF